MMIIRIGTTLLVRLVLGLDWLLFFISMTMGLELGVRDGEKSLLILGKIDKGYLIINLIYIIFNI